MVAHPVARGSGLRKIALDPHRGRLRESREPQKQAGAPPLRVGLGSGYARCRRWLCSHLVELEFDEDRFPPRVANLEEIAANGAVLGGSTLPGRRPADDQSRRLRDPRRNRGSSSARNRFSALRALIHVGAFNLWLVLRKKLGRAVESNCTEIATQFAPRRFTIQFASPLELLKIATSATGC